MENPPSSPQQPTPNPLIFVSAPPPPNHIPASWLELPLKDKEIVLNMNLGNQPLIVVLQDPAYIAQVLKDVLNHSLERLETQVWLQTLLQPDMISTSHQMPSQEFNSIMNQMYQNLSFFLVNAPNTEIPQPTFTQWSA